MRTRAHRAQSTSTQATGDELSYETERFEILSGQAREDVALSWGAKSFAPCTVPTDVVEVIQQIGSPDGVLVILKR